MYPYKYLDLLLKDKQDVAILIFTDMENRNFLKDNLTKLKRVLAKVPDFYDPLILKTFIKADTNQNGEISWNQLKDLVRLMKVDLTKKIKDTMRGIIGRNKVQTIDFSEFEKVWKIFYCRNELVEVFQKYNNEQFKSMDELLLPKLDSRQFSRFLKEQQKQDDEDIKYMVSKIYNDNLSYSISFYDFCHYIFGPNNNLLYINQKQKNQEHKKSLPLNHYYCYSSHNTYLTGDQIFSDSRVERYLVDLENGLRCVEIDVHDGRDAPIVKHGYTPTSSILFEDVIKSIKRFTDLNEHHTPIILSLEVHCNAQNQQKMADILIEQFSYKKIYLIDPKQDQFPTLHDCIGKIIVKGPGDYELFKSIQKSEQKQVSGEFTQEQQEEYKPTQWGQQFFSSQNKKLSQDFLKTQKNFIKKINQLEKEKKDHFDMKKKFKKAKMQPTKIQSIFQSSSKNSEESNNSMQKQKYHEKYKVSGKLLRLISMLSKGKIQNQCCWQSNSFSQNKLRSFCNDPKIFDEMRTLSNKKWFRSYPGGMRILSSNYNPIPALELGVQIVAINTQSKNDVNSQILKSFFTKVSKTRTGYREKVHLDRRSESKGNIMTRAQNNLKENQLSDGDLLIGMFDNHVHKRKMIKAQIKFISGLRIYQNDETNKNIPPVEVRAYFSGTQRDNRRNQRVLAPKQYTQILYNEAFNPKFNKIEPFELKCLDPELGFIIVEVPDCGRSVIPVDFLRNGWRVISLFDQELKEKQSKILCHIEVTKSTVDISILE